MSTLLCLIVLVFIYVEEGAQAKHHNENLVILASAGLFGGLYDNE